MTKYRQAHIQYAEFAEQHTIALFSSKGTDFLKFLIEFSIRPMQVQTLNCLNRQGCNAAGKSQLEERSINKQPVNFNLHHGCAQTTDDSERSVLSQRCNFYREAARNDGEFIRALIFPKQEER